MLAKNAMQMVRRISQFFFVQKHGNIKYKGTTFYYHSKSIHYQWKPSEENQSEH